MTTPTDAEIGENDVDAEAALSFDLGGSAVVIEGARAELHGLIERQRAVLDATTDEDDRPIRALDTLVDVLDADQYEHRYAVSAQIREAIALGVLLATAPTRSEALARFLPEDDDLDKVREHLGGEPGEEVAQDLRAALAFIEATG